MSGEGAWTPRDVPPEEVVDRCPCGRPMELVVGPTAIYEHCAGGHRVTHYQLVEPEAFAEG